MDDSLNLLTNTLALVLSRENDFNVLPHVHTILAFLWSIYNLTVGPAALISKVLNSIPWGKIVDFLNTFIKSEPIEDLVADAGRRGSFLHGAPKPLPEDYLLRGLVWCRGYFVSGWFDEKHDEESRLLELPSTNKVRIDRVMRLSICLSQVSLQFWTCVNFCIWLIVAYRKEISSLSIIPRRSFSSSRPAMYVFPAKSRNMLRLAFGSRSMKACSLSEPH